MEKRQAILQQFKVRMEKKYGTINKDQASSILSKLLEKSKVSEKDFKDAEVEIKLNQNQISVNIPTSLNEYHEDVKTPIKKRVNRKYNSSVAKTKLDMSYDNRYLISPDVRANKAKIRENCSQNNYNLAGGTNPKVLSESGSSILRASQASDPFHKSVVVYSEDYLTRHSKNLENEKQKMIYDQQKEKQKMKEFLAKQINQKSKAMVDSFMNEK